LRTKRGTHLRWNVSKEARRYARADAIVVSIPKSGRTWLRVFLCAYFCGLAGRPFSFDILHSDTMPRVAFTHDLWEHWYYARLKDRLRGKHLVPRRVCREKPIILLVRDPRDVVVSLYFQVTRRDQSYHGTLAEMIRHQTFGIEPLVHVLNTWLATWGERPGVKLVRYEDCRADTARMFGEVLTFLGLEYIDTPSFADSVAFCRFENMQHLEATGKFATSILSPGDAHDTESFKVRRGVVQGYHDYLAADDIRYLDRAIVRLDKRYGYR
jgi:Sulfotransferase domain